MVYPIKMTSVRLSSDLPVTEVVLVKLMLLQKLPLRFLTEMVMVFRTNTTNALTRKVLKVMMGALLRLSIHHKLQLRHLSLLINQHWNRRTFIAPIIHLKHLLWHILNLLLQMSLLMSQKRRRLCLKNQSKSQLKNPRKKLMTELVTKVNHYQYPVNLILELRHFVQENYQQLLPRYIWSQVVFYCQSMI